MLAIGSLLLVIALSLLIVRIGTIALTMTGLSEEVARFQSLSAFSGAGYTTDEAETVVSSTERRLVISWLIRAGSVGAVSAVSTTILSFAGIEDGSFDRLLVLAFGAAALVALARSNRLNRWATPIIRRVLRRFTTLELKDYAGLLHMHDDWSVAVIGVSGGSWLEGHSLGELRLSDEGVRVLGVECHDGDYLGVPDGSTVIEAGDELILYGHSQRIKELKDRQDGDEAAHDRAKHSHESEQDSESRRDETRSAEDREDS